MRKFIGDILSRLGLKKWALRVYFFFSNEYDNWNTRRRKKRIPVLIERRSRNNIYAIDLDSDWLGLGARIVKTIEILLYCQEVKMTPFIRYDYGEKRKHRADYFGELFYFKNLDREKADRARYTHVRDVDELGWSESYNSKLKLKNAKIIFDRYLGIQPDILSEVTTFVFNNFQNRKVLGIHYRGTDKAGEAPLVAIDKLLEYIRTTLRENPTLDLIFVSTDDAQILSLIHHTDWKIEVIHRDDAIRSEDGRQFHREAINSKSVINRDAIVNMLLLSKCDYLLKTASILSDCSIIFNPSIPVRLISIPHNESLTWWPATEIIQNQKDSMHAVAQGK